MVLVTEKINMLFIKSYFKLVAHFVLNSKIIKRAKMIFNFWLVAIQNIYLPDAV